MFFYDMFSNGFVVEFKWFGCICCVVGMNFNEGCWVISGWV